MQQKRVQNCRLWLSACLSIFLVAGSVSFGQELTMSNEEFKQLEQFEAHSLTKADKIFNDKHYNQAAKEYESFLQEFPRSSAVPYVILRKGRCLHLDDKRFQAIRVYEELLDFFPNRIPYAAAALYYMGLAHWQNGDVDKAIPVWAELADDVDYSKEPLAADAMNQLASHFVKQNQPDKAVTYYSLVAINFRKSNADAARKAMAPVIQHYVKTRPDVAKLREFYEQVQTFEHHPRQPGEDINEDTLFWQRVREAIERFNDFPDLQKDLKQRYFQYWVSAMQGKFATWDDYQIDLARYQLQIDGNGEAYLDRLSKQFDAHQKEGDFGRIVKWIRLVAGNKDQVTQYYGKLQFDKMPNDQIIDLVYICFDALKEPELARNTYQKIRQDQLNDTQRRQLGRNLWHRDEKLFVENCQYWEDKDGGRMELLRYRHWQYAQRRVADYYTQGMALATEMSNHPDYASEAWWLKAEMLQWSNKFEEAIQAYTQCDRPPESLFRIAECYTRLGKLTPAVGQLREIENFFGDRAKYQESAPRAALTAAYYYRDAKQHKEYVAELRKVMKKYNWSSQSSVAHQLLEEMGEKIGGAVDDQS